MTPRPHQHPHHRPTLSIVVPVYNGGQDFELCLRSVVAAMRPGMECIVVDDRSTDGSAEVAEAMGLTVMRLEKQSGPAHARNQGALRAQSDLLFFTDADCCVHEDTFEIAVDTLTKAPELAAVIGSYDEEPGSSQFTAAYKNLFHHWVHQKSRAEASTFWTGCGAVRRDVFLQMGGFHCGYTRPSIEDIEFGFRLRRAGHRIRLEKQMLTKHMKRWRFWNLIKTDLFLRGVPWIALMMRDRYAPQDLNLSAASKIGASCALLFVAVVLGMIALGFGAATLPVILALAIAGAGAHLREKDGSTITWRTPLVLTALVAAPTALAVWIGDPFAIVPFLPWLGIIGTHLGFYSLLTRRRGLTFATATAPMQLSFHLVCAASLPLGMLTHWRDKRRARRLQSGPAIASLEPLRISTPAATAQEISA